MQAVNGEEALKIVKWFRPHIVISDIRMPKMDGIAFAEELLGLAPESKIIFISGYLETEYLKSAIRLSPSPLPESPALPRLLCPKTVFCSTLPAQDPKDKKKKARKRVIFAPIRF